MDIIDETTAKIQNVYPGVYVWHEDSESFLKVIEYPITTGQAVFVNLSGGEQISGKLDTDVTVAVWG